MALINDYIKKSYEYIELYGEKTVLLMQVGGFYEIYALNDNKSKLYEIIYDVCDNIGLNIAEKSICVGSNKVLGAGFRDYNLDKWLNKILANNYICVVYSQDSNGKNTTRSLTGIYTPGTNIGLDDTKNNNNNMCLWIELIKQTICIGIANINIVTGKSQIYEYNIKYTNIPNIYDDIERYISVYNPCEIQIISNLSIDKINSIIQYVNIQSTSINFIDLNDKSSQKTIKARKCENQKYQKEIFAKYFEISNMNNFLEKYQYCEIATQCFCYLVNHLDTLNANLVDKIVEPVIDNLTDRLILANHSSKQLNIVSDSTNKYGSILNLTNNTMTIMGKRKHRELLLHPIINNEKLNHYYDTTEKILEISDMKDIFRTNLRNMIDIEKITKLIILSTLPVKCIYSLCEDFKKITNICNYLHDFSFLHYLNDNIILDKVNHISNYINKHINVSDCKNIAILETNIFNKGIYNDLDDVIEKEYDCYDKLQSLCDYFDNLMSLKLKPKKPTSYLKLHETEKSGFSIQITKTRKPILESIIKENNSNNFEINYTSSLSLEKKMFLLPNDISIQTFNSSIHVTSDYINKLTKQHLYYKNKVKELVVEKYNLFLLDFKKKAKDLYLISDFVTEVDIIQNRAYIANKYNYCKPQIIDQDISNLKAKSLRHPLIENINTDEIYTANDVNIGNEEPNILLFGTNAVGKTSLIKSIGIAILLAQSGMYVPASEFIYTPYKQLFTRILNCDNLFKGLSTFTLEMSEMSNIFKYTDKNSLVLGDELCSGTELPSAMCIFISGLTLLSKRQSSFIFATHFHELLNFDEMKEIDNMVYKHMSVEYDIENDCIIYDRKIKNGSGDKIYGLEVCKSLHLPDDFMNNALEILNKYYKKDTLSFNHSHYNANKIKNVCEICKENKGEDIHHLLYQSDAKQNFISNNINNSIHKNHNANLINICKDCHDYIHDNNIRMIKKYTTKGYELKIV